MKNGICIIEKTWYHDPTHDLLLHNSNIYVVCSCSIIHTSQNVKSEAVVENRFSYKLAIAQQ